MGNVAYYLKEAEWAHLLTEGVQLFVYTVKAMIPKGNFDGMTWETHDGQVVFKMDDGDMWQHYQDWRERLTGVHIMPLWTMDTAGLRHTVECIIKQKNQPVRFVAYPTNDSGFIDVGTYLRKTQRGPTPSTFCCATTDQPTNIILPQMPNRQGLEDEKQAERDSASLDDLFCKTPTSLDALFNAAAPPDVANPSPVNIPGAVGEPSSPRLTSSDGSIPPSTLPAPLSSPLGPTAREVEAEMADNLRHAERFQTLLFWFYRFLLLAWGSIILRWFMPHVTSTQITLIYTVSTVVARLSRDFDSVIAFISSRRVRNFFYNIWTTPGRAQDYVPVSKLWQSFLHYVNPNYAAFWKWQRRARSKLDFFASERKDTKLLNRLAGGDEKLRGAVINSLLSTRDASKIEMQLANIARANDVDALTVSRIAQDARSAIEETRRRARTFESQPSLVNAPILAIFAFVLVTMSIYFFPPTSRLDWTASMLLNRKRAVAARISVEYGLTHFVSISKMVDVYTIVMGIYYVTGLAFENMLSAQSPLGALVNIILDTTVRQTFHPVYLIHFVFSLSFFSKRPLLALVAHYTVNVFLANSLVPTLNWAPGVFWLATISYQICKGVDTGTPLDDLRNPSCKPGYGNYPVCAGHRKRVVRPGSKVTPPYGKCSAHGLSFRVAGPRCKQATVYSFKGCTCNATGALLGRMAGIPKRYKDNPEWLIARSDPITTYFEKLADSMDVRMRQGVPPFFSRKPVRLTHEQWAKRYTSETAANMRQSWLNGGASVTYSSFVKAEKSTLMDDGTTLCDESLWTLDEGILQCSSPDLPDPRGISVPAEAVRYNLGPDADYYNKLLMSRFSGQVLYVCGLNSNDLADWVNWVKSTHDWGIAVMGDDVLILTCEDGVWRATSLDISRFDMHIRECHLVFSYNLMRMAGLGRLAHALQEMGLRRKYVIRAVLQSGKANIRGTRASGDPDTISSNSVITIVLAWHALLNGLDVRKVFFDAGFVTTGTTSDFNSPKWDFLQKLFYPCEIDGAPALLPAPKVGRFASRAFWTRGSTDHKSLAYAKGVCLGLEKDFQHVPIASAIIRRVLELSRDVNPEFDKNELRELEFKGHAERPATMTTSTILFFCERYGITPAEVVSIEDHISQWDWGQFLDDCEEDAWRKILTVDLA